MHICPLITRVAQEIAVDASKSASQSLPLQLWPARVLLSLVAPAGVPLLAEPEVMRIILQAVRHVHRVILIVLPAASF